MSEPQPSRHARTIAVSALAAGFVLFVLAIVTAVSGGGGGGGDEVRVDATTATTAPRPARRPAREAPRLATEPSVPANAPGAHKAPDEAVPILAYEVVNQPRTDTADPSVWVPPDEFEAQMTYLADNGYHPVTVRQMWAAWKDGGVLPSKPIVISFDTGYHSVYASALPVMRERSFPGTLFLAPRQLEADFPESEVTALIEAGWELDAQPAGDGSDLTSATDEQLDLAIVGARRELQRRFGRRVDFFSYPAGRFDERVAGAVEAAGFLGAVTLEEGPASPEDPPHELPRIPVRNGDGADGLARKLEAAGQGQ
jgi:peptidoglycan/xylan/chitin deacetylase (PgdA/CDA1 family)